MTEETKLKIANAHKGLKPSLETRKKMSQTHKRIGTIPPNRTGYPAWNKDKKWLEMSGENHPNWKGDKVGYKSLHKWGHRHIPKPKFCQDCKKVPPYDLANISQEYKRDLTDWEWLCRSCHMKKDNRINNIKQHKNYGN